MSLWDSWIWQFPCYPIFLPCQQSDVSIDKSDYGNVPPPNHHHLLGLTHNNSTKQTLQENSIESKFQQPERIQGGIYLLSYRLGYKNYLIRSDLIVKRLD